MLYASDVASLPNESHSIMRLRNFPLAAFEDEKCSAHQLKMLTSERGAALINGNAMGCILVS
jgi:hypothetical protein